MKQRILASLLGLGLLLPVCPTQAQEINGTILGVVTDQTGAVLPGAVVVVKNVRTGLVRELVTNEAGRYLAAFLPVGTYDLTVTMSGFQTWAARAIEVHVSDRIALNPQLQVEGLATEVMVTAAASSIQPTGQVQNLMGATQVTELPINNRNFMQLATLVPGVTSALDDEAQVGLTSRADISINGKRRNSVNWLVDGASNVDVGSNITLLATPTLESIEEFKVITSNFSAEWPRSGGGVVNVVTKSGTNTFRASAYEFFRDDSLNANSFFRNMSSNPDIAGKPAQLDYHNFGYTVGGPILKDKFFFFWSQEWRKIERAPSNLTANVIDPAWLNDPANPNYVAPALRDPNAVRLLAAWPQPNVGTNRYVATAPNKNDTRQEVLRLDYTLSPKWRAMARYTHDQSVTEELGGLFFGIAVPGVATTETTVPGNIFVLQLTGTLNASTLNEFSYQFSSNRISTENPDGTRGRREDYGYTGNELFAQNNSSRMPTLSISGLSLVGSNQLINIEYKNHTFTDNLTLVRGNHTIKVGGLVTFEQKNENAANETQGRYTFVSAGGFTAFQNFLRGNAGGLCGTGCTYSEAERDVTNHLRFNRYEMFVQDTWKPRSNLTFDFGLRYALYPGVQDNDDVLTNFVPELWSRAAVPTFANTAGTLLTAGTGNPLNGIVVAGSTSPYGRRIHATDKNNVAPRFGFSWNPDRDGKMIVRGGVGWYFDQPLVGIFEQNAFVNPPYVNTVTVQNPVLGNPAAGVPAGTTAVRNLIASSDPFDNPRTIEWNIGVVRQLYSRGVAELTYVGTRGDSLIRPIEINQAQPADVVRLGSLNLARPYLGWGTIQMRQTSGRSRYHGLLFNFRHDAGRAGLVNVAYTLSRNKVDATNDRDAIDLPQNPLDLDAEYALARTDRTHVLSVNWVYELPFFKDAKGLARHALGGWQVSGIGTFQSGPPIPRIALSNTNGGRRGNRANQVSDPFANVPAGLYWFNPAAYSAPVDGTYGNTGRALFRLPGRNQWDVTVSKNWYPSSTTRLQFRADFINALNHTQFTTVDASCTAGTTQTNLTCAVPGSTFGQVTGTRLPREIQLGLKFYWN